MAGDKLGTICGGRQNMEKLGESWEEGKKQKNPLTEEGTFLGQPEFLFLEKKMQIILHFMLQMCMLSFF